jgi:predicted AAA+ superfamily ATPase
MIVSRLLRNTLLETLKVSPVVFVNGARQAGKSTLVLNNLTEIGKNGIDAAYITFDNATQMAAAASAPEAFLSAYENTLVLDEVQMVPEIFRALKARVDQLRIENKPDSNGRYLLTGSANILALPQLSESLVGRMNVLTLYPFCTAEVSNGKGTALARIFSMDFSGMDSRGVSVAEAIKGATYPEIFDKEHKEITTWFDGYISTILQRDVKMLADLEKISVLPSLLRVLASRAGNLINDADLSRDVGLNAVTGKFYRNILKMMFLTIDVPPWYRNIGKRLVKSSKGYLIDTLFLCYLLGLKLEELVKNRPDLFGHVLENYVAIELTKLLSFSESGAELYHFRTSDGKEVDFVLEKPNGNLWGIEVKNSDTVSAKDFNGLKLFAELTGKDFQGGIVLYSGKEAVPFGQNLWAVPHYLLWQ